MASIIHFNINAENPENVKVFYEKLFDWKFELLPGPMQYYLIETKQINGNKGVGGGMAKISGDEKKGFSNFIGVESIDHSLEQVKKLGGQIIQGKQSIPTWGFMALCTDVEGNLFGLFEDEKK